MTKRILIAGFGDTGLLVGIHLAADYEVVGISPKPCLVSGQELGVRLTQPETWKQDYLMAYDRYKKLDGVRTVHGLISGIDTIEQRVAVTLPDGGQQEEPYDVLVLASGVTNGFWRNDAIEDLNGIKESITQRARQLRDADTIAIVGGGATGVGSAANMAERFPEKNVHLFYSQDAILPGYHPKVRNRLADRLNRLGVELHPNHRARVPDDFEFDQLTSDPLEWTTGQPPFCAAATLWAVGNTKPNSGFIPAEMLDEAGYVKVEDTLRVPGQPNIFAVGDIAASDRHRSSARNWGYRLVAHNVRCFLIGDEERMKRYDPPAYRWGSILGLQKNGLQVFQTDGGSFRFPRWLVRLFLFPIAVRRVIYRGVRR